MSSDSPDSPNNNAGPHNSSQISSAPATSGMKSNINLGEQQLQNKNRICRDFVRGSCRRLHCKVRDTSNYIFPINNILNILVSSRFIK